MLENTAFVRKDHFGFLLRLVFCLILHFIDKVMQTALLFKYGQTALCNIGFYLVVCELLLFCPVKYKGYQCFIPLSLPYLYSIDISENMPELLIMCKYEARDDTTPTSLYNLYNIRWSRILLAASWRFLCQSQT